MSARLAPLRCVVLGCVLVSPLASCGGRALDAGTTYVTASAAPVLTRATVDAMIDAIAMDRESLYFTCEDGWLYRLPKTGSEPAERIAEAAAPGSNYTGGIAVDDTNVYWTALGDGVRNGAVKRVAKSGGTVVTLAEERPRPLGIAVDDTNVYWTDEAAPGSTTGVEIGAGAILMMPKVGGAPLVRANGLDSADVIALDGSGVLWHDAVGIQRVPIAGGPTIPLLRMGARFRSSNLIVANGTAYFAADQGTWSIQSIETAGGMNAILAEDLHAAPSIAVDGSNVFFTDPSAVRDKTAIVAVPRAGGRPTPLVWPSEEAPGARQPKFLLVDDRAFYAVELTTALPLVVEIRVFPR